MSGPDRGRHEAALGKVVLEGMDEIVRMGASLPSGVSPEQWSVFLVAPDNVRWEIIVRRAEGK